MGELFLKTEVQQGLTVIADCFFTAPLKVAKPFYRPAGTEIMLMCASPGMLEGDSHQLEFVLGAGSSALITEQSYMKLFKMECQAARRQVKITVEEGAACRYLPLPVIPFAGSRFQGRTDVYLARTSRFFLCDILACGRVGMGERFLFSDYVSRLAIHVEGRLVFLEHTRLLPSQAEIGGIGFFEGYAYQGLIYLYGWELDDLPAGETVEAAMTKPEAGILICALANRGEDILAFARQLCARTQ
jgi:urease accessory protein